jgi:glycosyltransferase involved in cell wall biosynthesis
MKPAFSVLMANFNKGGYVGEAIESVLKQDFKDWELVIIDDGSTDNSEEIINRYLKDPRIKLVKNEQNLGTISTQSKLIKLSSARIIGILDSDDALAPDAIGKVMKAFEENLDCGFVYSQCWYCDENLKPLHLGFSAAIPQVKTNLHSNSVVALRSFKRDAYFKTTGYDEVIKYAEDIDLTLKIEEVTKLNFIDKPLYYYRILPKSQTHSFFNTAINRSSTALAKLNAYQRRIGTNIPNLNESEISEVLFFGIITSALAGRWKLAKKFIAELIKIRPFFLFNPKFYGQISRKIKKIIRLKKKIR